MHVALNFEERKEGDWSIETFYEDGIKYQKLVHKGIIKMINTPNIIKDFEVFLTVAEGAILINGLGFGMCIVELLKKNSVTDITVVEYDKSLVDFITPLFKEESRCKIIHDDAFTFEPPSDKQYDYVWHDIWTTQSPNNLKDMKILFAKYKAKAGWQGAWRQQKCQEQAIKEGLELKGAFDVAF